MDKREIRQQLLQLENTDVVQKWFQVIHGRKLNRIRTREINSAAKQSSEFFRNAELANYAVRPLLAYYGINALSRALVLLLNPTSGENSLKPGHGLETVNWNKVLFGTDFCEKLKGIGQLEVKTCSGLFSELVVTTNNRIYFHVNSDAVGWQLDYDIPELGYCFTFDELIARIPDLSNDLKNLDIEEKYYHVNGLSYSNTEGFKCQVNSKQISIESLVEELGYGIKKEEQMLELSCSSGMLCENLPLFYHGYVNKSIGVIPQLYIVQPFKNKNYYSELAVVFLLSYYLGMLVRYYPTHWNALIQGEKGDAYWPILNRIQNYVEIVYPELVVEFINSRLKEKGFG